MGVVEIALQNSFAEKKEGIAGRPWLIPVKSLYISPGHATKERDLGRELDRRRRHSPSYLAAIQSEIQESLRGFDNNEIPDFDALDSGVSEVFAVTKPQYLHQILL